MDWLSFALGLGGLGIAALSVILSYRERRAGLRQAVFEKQAEGCIELLKEIERYYRFLLKESRAAHTAPVESGQIRRQMIDLFEELDTCVTVWDPLLPRGVNQAIAKVYSTLETFIDNPASKDCFIGLENALMATRDAIRAYLGVEPLSRETGHILGTKAE